MGSMGMMRDILNEADGVKPIAVAGGKKVYSFADANILNQADILEERAAGRQIDLGEREVRPDGLYSRSHVKRAAIDPNVFFENRYRKSGNAKSGTEYEVVTDYRAIKEQASGQVYTNNVAVYVIGKSGDGASVKEVKTISAEEFINGFKRKLDYSSMLKVQKAIASLGSNVQADSMEL